MTTYDSMYGRADAAARDAKMDAEELRGIEAALVDLRALPELGPKLRVLAEAIGLRDHVLSEMVLRLADLVEKRRRGCCA